MQRKQRCRAGGGALTLGLLSLAAGVQGGEVVRTRLLAPIDSDKLEWCRARRRRWARRVPW